MAKDHETASLSQVPETEPSRKLASTPLEAGSAVGRYTVRAPLGAGGMGEVYLARDPELDRLVALKLIRPDRLGAPARSRFLREAQALAKLSHPNVVTVFDAGESKVASALHAKGALEPAEAHARLALELQRADPRRTDTAIEDGLANLADIIADRGDIPGAIALHRESMEETARIYGPDSPTLAERRLRLAMFLSRGGDWAGADALLQTAMPTLLAAQGEDHHAAILGLSFWATVADKLRRPTDALARLDRAIAGAEQETQLGNLLPRLLERRGKIRLATGDAAGAKADFDRAKTLAAQNSR